MNNFWQKAINMLITKDDKSTEVGLIWRKEAEQAKLDWIYAHKYYNNLTDIELVDYAAYMILATERRYMYILKKIKSYEKCSIEFDKDSDNGVFVTYNSYIMKKEEG